MSDRPYKAEQRRGHYQQLVMAKLAKRKRTKDSIMVFSSISKRSELVRQFENLFRSKANMFIFKNLNIEAKRRKLSLICESSEAKRTSSFPKIKLAKRSELYWFILKYEGQKTKGFASKLSKFCHYCQQPSPFYRGSSNPHHGRGQFTCEGGGGDR